MARHGPKLTTLPKKNPDQTVAEKLRVRVTTGIILQGGLIDILSQFVVEKLKFGH